MRVNNQPVEATQPQGRGPARPKRRLGGRLFLGAAAALLILVLWLAVTAPLSKSLQPVPEPSITLLAADGAPIARRGAIVQAPVKVEELPDHVYQAFLAIEDHRFYNHAGIDPIAMARAGWSNVRAGGVREGASTITQQLAKLAFLNSDRTLGRKLQEIAIAFWLEMWLTKNEILSRYLSSVYFGDNVYGLRAAAAHYFDKTPERLSVEEAAMLAGIVKAPSKLAPTSNLEGARERATLVIQAMLRERLLSEAQVAALKPARIRQGGTDPLPSGTYFADWIFAQMDQQDPDERGRRVVRTTLERRLQALAVRATAGARLHGSQVALVAMRPDGRVVAMVGGRDYAESQFNRATQARRQPGSAFKIFVYLAALDEGMRPATPVPDVPVTIDGWSPANADGVYRGMIPLREAFAVSSNVAAVRIADEVGREKVVEVARRLGVTSPLDENPSMALGTSTMTLLELTAAYAGVASNAFPVAPRGAREPIDDAPRGNWSLDEKTVLPMTLDLLWSSANAGTGRAAALPVPTFGKTGTSQDSRDAVFVGFARDLVVGVWVGRDDNAPLAGLTGGGRPAEIWRNFMASALNLAERTVLPTPEAKREETQGIRRTTITPERGAAAEQRRGFGKGKGKGKKKKRKKGRG